MTPLPPKPPLTAEQLFARLDALGVAHKTHAHAPVFTVEESQSLRGILPGTHVKNLFLRDKKKRKWLLTAAEDCHINLKSLKRYLGAAGSLSFGDAEMLMSNLGVIPGAVTPFAIVNDPEQQVSVILDKNVAQSEIVNAHPLRNDMTTAVTAEDLLAFLTAESHAPEIVDFEKIETAP